MWRSLYIRTLIMRSADYPYIIRIVLYLNINAYLAQLCRNRLKVLRYNVLERNITAGSRRSHHKRSRFYLVGDNRILCAVKL